MKGIFLAMLVALTAASYDVDWNCGSCKDSGGECIDIDGGPFKHFQSTVTSCASTGIQFPLKIQFNCGSGCGDGCGITAKMGNLEESRCTTDIDGAQLVLSLDQLYSISIGDLTGQAKYDWCGDLTCIATWLIVLIVLAVLAIIGVIVFVVIRNRRKAKHNNLLAQEGSYNKH